MPILSQAARRYAQALVEAAPDAAGLERLRQDLTGFGALLSESADLRNLLLNPVFTAFERRAALDGVAARLGTSPTVVRFLDVVAEGGRMGELEEIITSFVALADRQAGRLRATVTSAIELTAAQVAKLKHVLEMRTQKSVELSVTVDPTLIGGMRAQVGSQVLDGSLQGELSRLRTLLEASD